MGAALLRPRCRRAQAGGLLALQGHDAACIRRCVCAVACSGAQPRRPLTFAAPLASRRSQTRRENSVATLLRSLAGGEELRSLRLPLECTAEPLRPVRQAARPPPLSSRAPWPYRTQRSGREEEGGQELLSHENKAQSSGTPAIHDLACAKAPPVVCWPGDRCIFRPPAVPVPVV
ncbi:hypothetical protein SVAN01_04726 [Stagonosporopsis vannaccii]|nr:hypothetical protein SVAN01_04726 [Stagonosporopsis vannaccii]